jgi:hypothetical protein
MVNLTWKSYYNNVITSFINNGQFDIISSTSETQYSLFFQPQEKKFGTFMDVNEIDWICLGSFLNIDEAKKTAEMIGSLLALI